MDYKRANRTFLYMILATLAYSLVYTMWLLRTGIGMPIMLNNIISESMILIPSLAAVMYCGDNLGQMVPFKPVKISTVLLTVVYMLLLFPLVAFVNSVSMFFVDNTVMGLSDSILSMPMWQMLLTIGVFAPFVEEFVFRGVILHSYQRTGKIVGSIILSAVLFGMMHLNFNQFAYATVMGIMFAILVNASGSVLTSFIAHAVFNSIEVVMMYATSDILGEASDYLDSVGGAKQMLLTTAILLVVSIISTAIALCVVVKISDIEGRSAFFTGILKRKKKPGTLITIPLIIAMVIAAGYMIVTEFLMNII